MIKPTPAPTDSEGKTPMQKPPNETQAQLRWLVDRAQISDVLVEYARCADAADWSGMGELFTEDGQAVFAAGSFPGRNFGDAPEPSWQVSAAHTTCQRTTRSKST